MGKTGSTSGGADQGAPFQLPPDLTVLSDDELAELRSQAESEFDAIYEGEGGPRVDDFARAEELATAIEQISADEDRRTTEAQDTADRFAQLRARVRPETEPAAESDGEVLEGEVVEEPAEQQPEPVAASGRPVGGARTGLRELGGVDGPKRRLNPSLSGARQRAPEVKAPGSGQLAITAAAGVPGKTELGGRLADLSQLAELLEHRAQTLPDARAFADRRYNGRGPFGGATVARIRNEFDKTVDFDRTTPAETQQMMRSLTDPEILVAGGGWCAPSQVRYDFFNIACVDGEIDLPTFGVERGGVRFPVSPSLADVFTNPGGLAPFGAAFSAVSVPWLWTETDDAATVTGSGNKPCIRVPCPSISEVRLECYGICLTAGNLADDAWPENTRNFLGLLMAAHQRASNSRYIQSMQSLSVAALNVTGCGAGSGAAAPLLGVAALAATDIRNRFGMCRDDIIEAIYPDWVLEMFRSDLAKRMGVSDFMGVTDAQIAQWFDTRDIRAQFVADYQVRGIGQPGNATPQTAWPTSVEFMMFPPGTFGRGNGMTLDLGVVRDSTLNAENDFTAAWMEECHLIARFGHESRRYNVTVCTDGTVGAADLTGCCA